MIYSPKKIKILFIDPLGESHPLVRSISEKGYMITCVQKASGLLRILKDDIWDLIFLSGKFSVNNPEKLLGSISGSGYNPYVIILTEEYNDQRTAKLLKAGARDVWVLKEIHSKALLLRLERVVQELKTTKKLDNTLDKIRRMERESRRVLDAMADPVMVVNNDHRIIVYNPAFEKVFGGVDRQTPCYQIVYQRKSPCPWCAEVSRENTSFVNTRHLVKKDSRYFQSVIGPVKLNGDKVYKMSLYRDITESVEARQKAERNEAVLKSLIASARDGIVGLNRFGKVVLYNQAALNLLNKAPEELKTKKFSDHFSVDKYLLRFNRLFRELIAGQSRKLTEIKRFRLTIERNNREKIIEASLSENKIKGEELYLFMLRDVTEQHHAENELLKEKTLLYTLIDNIPDNIFIKDARHRFLMSNKAHCHHLGVASAEELIGKTDRDLYPPELADAYWNDEEKIIRTRTPVINRKEKTYDAEGRERWILTSKIPVVDGYDRVTRIIGISRDITDLEINEQELRRSHRRLEGLLEISLSDNLEKEQILDLALEKAIELTDSEIGYIYFYDEKKKLFTLHSWSDEAMEQCSVTNKRTTYSLEKTGIWGEAVRQRRPVMINDYSWENPLKKGLPKGHVPLKRFLTIPVFHQNEIVAVAGIANKVEPYNQTDVIQLELLMDNVWKLLVQKEQRQVLISAREKAEEAERLKSVFMSTMSHELRTPLNGILGFSQLIESSSDIKEAKQYAGYITESGDRLLSMIENIFYVSVVEGKQLQVNYGLISPAEIIENSLKRFTSGRIPDTIRLMKKYDPEEGVEIQTDSRMVGQILTALLDNAVKFTKEGSITVGYSLSEGSVEFYVADTGIGIPEDKYDQVFEKFRQLDERLSREYEGIGIGLYLVRRLTEALKGKVWIEPNKPRGSVFRVRIPAETMKKERTTGTNAPKTQNAKMKKNVLIAEDNPMSAMLLKKIVQDLGMEVVHAENGLEALNHVKNNQPCDLILMDLNMPVMDGFEAIQGIKQIRDDIPIIIQTAYDTETGRQKARELQVSDFVSKPVNREDLVQKINRYVTGPGIMI